MTVPTAKGLRLAEEALEALNGFHAPMFEKLSEKDQTRLLETLAKMHECVCEGGKTGACDKPFNN